MDSDKTLKSFRFHLAYFVPPVKFEELRFDVFLELCGQAQIATTELNDEFFNQYLKEKNNSPSFDLIIHTLSDIICETVDPAWLQLLDYLRMQSPKTIIIDSPDKIFPLLDRYEQYCILSDAAAKGANVFHVPPYLRVLEDDDEHDIESSLAKLSINFPLICKPLKCDAPLSSHYHKIVFDKEHLTECNRPCILQQFIEHDAVLFKINVVGKDIFQVVERKSVRNLKNEKIHDTIAFNSLDVSGLDSNDELSKNQNGISPSAKIIDETRLQNIAHLVREQFQLNLLSIDILKVSNTNDYAVVDVNYFPCYDSMDDAPQNIFRLCLSKLEAK
ncbi:hypothetical protein I4U23_004206 [Adineta vaga]|nr:hypothetical protein I4U23_004206 [Adineta vaga]